MMRECVAIMMRKQDCVIETKECDGQGHDLRER